MKKLFAIILALTMVLSLAGCGASSTDGGVLNGGGIKGDAMFEGAVDGDIGAMAPEAAPGESGGDVLDVPGQKPQYQAGTLTAGEWSDLKNQEFWTKLLNRNDWYQLMEDRNLYANKIISVIVENEAGVRQYNAPVELLDEQGNVLYKARTTMQGEAYLLYDLHKTGETANAVRVGEDVVVLDGQTSVTVVHDEPYNGVSLDLMLMVDTTGSMGDELKYLQKELASVVEHIDLQSGNMQIRISVNFYRDESDDYIVRSFEFSGNIEEVLQQLAAQDADGGGDYPEAVHKALDSILQEHQWAPDATKICFFVMDAPPHSEAEIKGINEQMTKTVKAMAAEGIRLIPVASSGVNTETEFLLRSWAVMTGGTYTFLTDHSGVGNSHLEPTVGEYEVEKLNDLMVRLLLEYLSIPIEVPDV